MTGAPQLPARPPEPEGVEGDFETARPSVTITRNAKGAAQFTVKVYGVDASSEAALAAAKVAKSIYDDLAKTYGSVS